LRAFLFLWIPHRLQESDFLACSQLHCLGIETPLMPAAVAVIPPDHFVCRRVNPVRNFSGALNPAGIILNFGPAAELCAVPRFAGYRAEVPHIISNGKNILGEKPEDRS
jgi:hypothetical protein